MIWLKFEALVKKLLYRRMAQFLLGFRPVKQAITGKYYEDYRTDLPALQVEQVKKDCF
jgi:hypothetical protein